MIPSDLQLTDEAKREIENIDDRLDAMEQETERLLELRSEIVEQQS